MLTHVLCNCLLYGSGDEEILLLKPQLFSGIVVVIGVEDFHDVLCQIVLFNGLSVIALIKGIKLEALYRLSIPDTKGIYYAVSVAHYGHVIGDGVYGLIAVLDKVVTSVAVCLNPYKATELNLFLIFPSPEFEGIAVTKPVIGDLQLIAVLYLLLEHAVAVSDTAAVS